MTTSHRDIDSMRRADLAKLPGPEHAVALTLDEWNHRENGVTSSSHGAGLFLDLLAERGYQVTPSPMPPGLQTPATT